MNYLQRIEQLHPDIIDNYLQTGISRAIPDDLQIIIKQLSWAVEIWETERNITRASKKLKASVFAKQGITLGLMVCKQRIYDAMNYFNVDCNVSNKYWMLDAADKLEDYARLAVALDKPMDGAKIQQMAAEYRIKANAELSLADLQPPIFLISDKMTLEELGFEKKNLKEIAKKHSDGFYVELITKLPIEKSDKRKLMYDAGIEDATIIEELDNDGPTGNK